MLIFLLLIYVNCEEYNISTNTQKVIDKFDNYGEIFY